MGLLRKLPHTSRARGRLVVRKATEIGEDKYLVHVFHGRDQY